MPSFIRVLKDRLGHCARPEGRDEPFRARVCAEPAPFAALRAGFQRTDRSQPIGSRPPSLKASLRPAPPHANSRLRQAGASTSHTGAVSKLTSTTRDLRRYFMI